ncbi:MAG: two-component sensor histidine kinase, partial [Phaeodactylibacter sp.]|nr:two-component sensor histidine kinase [Phaeodactylibacter sp.]
MDIYARKSRWKLYLAIGGIVIVLISLLYTNYLATRLAAEERNKVSHWVQALQDFNKPMEANCQDCCDFTLHQEIITSNTTIPVMLVSESGSIVDALNFGPERDTNFVYLEKELARLQQEGAPPIETFGQKVYYKNSIL